MPLNQTKPKSYPERRALELEKLIKIFQVL